MSVVSGYPAMILSTEVNLQLFAAASFVLGRQHGVHKAETNPLEDHQLYTTYASNMHPEK